MKILTVCDFGLNRSIQFAHLLKWWNHDVIPIGLKNTTPETLDILYKWAEVIIVTEKVQQPQIPQEFQSKVKLFDVGPDVYQRPFNNTLYNKAKRILEQNKDWLKT